MGLLSSSVSITRYQVKGQLDQPMMDTVADALKKYSIAEIDHEVHEKSVGWTSTEHPFHPNFDGSVFAYGTYWVFSLRMDKKNISSKLLKKHAALEEARLLSSSGREFLAAREKKQLKEQVLHALCLRTPATPNVYDLVWNYEAGRLWFFSNLKAANETMEELFSRSFGLSLIRMFPYTAADLTAGLSDAGRDALDKLTPASFTR
ncbi:MAG TPA: recombination-associated protein RdgC [Desulfobacterales bacterium]